MREAKEALVYTLFCRRQIWNDFIHQLAICPHHLGPMIAEVPVETSIFLHDPPLFLTSQFERSL
jgi:hypothetical protein